MKIQSGNTTEYISNGTSSKASQEIYFRKFHKILMEIHRRSGRDSVRAITGEDDILTQWEKMTGIFTSLILLNYNLLLRNML